MKFAIVVALLIVLVGVDAEIFSYSYYGGLLKGSVVSIALISALAIAINFAIIRIISTVIKGKF